MERWRGWRPGEPILGGQVALVVGGGRGIGECTSRIMAEAGATVAVLDVVPERAEGVARSITESGGKAVPIISDVRIEDDCQGAVDAVVREFGRVDVLANIVGGMRPPAVWQPMHMWSTEMWDGIVHLNLRYVFWLCRAALPVMARHGYGSVVSVTSISGYNGSPNHSAYGAAKAGLIHLTKTLAAEYGRAGIRVNAMSPGNARTAAMEEGRTPEDLAAADARVSGLTPLNRMGTPEDMARAILFLASPMAAYISGQMLLVDGGISGKFPYGTRGEAFQEAPAHRA